jgi:hypothetical protein
LVVSEWWTKGGSVVFGSRPPLGLLPQLCPASFHAAPGGGINGFGSMTSTQCLVQHGYTEWASYQPISHLWPFQWIEGGWLLALSALLVTVTVWLVRRRAV